MRKIKPAPMLWILILLSILLAIFKWFGVLSVSWWAIPYPVLMYFAGLAIGIMIFSDVRVLFKLAKMRNADASGN